MFSYQPANWFWIVAGDESRWWSSAAAAYVPPVQAWLDAGNVPTTIDTEASLTDVLAQYGLTGPSATEQSALDQANLDAALAAPGSVVRALGLVTFQEINKLRVLAGQTAYTMPQFVAALKANMR